MFQQATSPYTPSPWLVHVGALIFSLTSWDSCRNLIALQAVSYGETTNGCLLESVQQGSLLSSDSIWPTRTSKKMQCYLTDICYVWIWIAIVQAWKTQALQRRTCAKLWEIRKQCHGRRSFCGFSSCLAVALKRCNFVFAGANLLLPPVRLYGPRVHAQNPKGNRWNSQKLLWSICAVATLHFSSCSACLAALVGLQLQLFVPELCALGYASLSRFEENTTAAAWNRTKWYTVYIYI